MMQMLQDMAQQIRRIAVASEAYNAKFTLLLTAIDTLNGATIAADPRIFLLDDDGKFLLDDSGKRIYILADEEDAAVEPTVTGTRHFISVDTATTIDLLPGKPGYYYQLTSLVLSGTAECVWKLKDGATVKTGYPVGDKGFGVVISLPENLFSTTTGNALVLDVTGGGNVLGHVIAYEYAAE